MRAYFAALSLVFSVNALAIDTYDATTNVFTVDAVVLNGIQYNNVVLKLNAYDVISVGSSAPYGQVTDTCSSANITVPIYNAIVAGMTLAQVNQTIGCKYSPALTTAIGDHVSHGWNYGGAIIIVYFDATDSFVKGIIGTDLFKSRTGF